MSEVVWYAVLDNRFKCAVVRKSADTGTLEIHDGDRLVSESDVGLSYGATFGPDVSDVNEWMDHCVSVVDKYTKTEEEKDK